MKKEYEKDNRKKDSQVNKQKKENQTSRFEELKKNINKD